MAVAALAFAAALLTQPDVAPHRPPAGNFADYIGSDDYPPGAIDKQQEGLVAFVVIVAPNGRVSDCTITRSSGFRELDAGTCRLARRRLRFNPGRVAGAAVPMRSREFRIDWRMPGSGFRAPRPQPAR